MRLVLRWLHNKYMFGSKRIKELEIRLIDLENKLENRIDDLTKIQLVILF